MLTLSATEFTFSERKLNDFHFVNQLGFSRRERPPHMRFLAIKSILAAVVVTTGSLPAHVAKANTTSTCCGLCSSAPERHRTSTTSPRPTMPRAYPRDGNARV